MRSLLVAALLLGAVGCGGERDVVAPPNLAGSWQLAMEFQGATLAGTAAFEGPSGNWGAYSASTTYEGDAILAGNEITWRVGALQIRTAVAPAMFNGSQATAARDIAPGSETVFYLYRPKL